MKPLSPKRCRELIAELAEIIPPIRGRPKSVYFSKEFPSLRVRELYDPVFTGGGVVPLLLTDPAAPPASHTKDVDLILEVVNESMDIFFWRHEFLNAGFTQEGNDLAEGLIYFWKGDRVDIIPHRGRLHGRNRWHEYVIKDPWLMEVIPGKSAWIVSAPTFLATKFEAYNDRGLFDPLKSRDLEGILAVVDGRQELLEEVICAPSSIRHFLSAECAMLLNDSRFEEVLQALLADRGRSKIVTDRLRVLSELQM